MGVWQIDIWQITLCQISGLAFGRLAFGRLTFNILTIDRLTFGRLAFGRLAFGRLAIDRLPSLYKLWGSNNHSKKSFIILVPDLSSHLFQLLERLVALLGGVLAEGLEGQLHLGQVGLGSHKTTFKVTFNPLFKKPFLNQ
jgi:hypothetical protein